MNNRKLLIIALILIGILVGCSNKEDGNSFIATILEIQENSLLVEPVEGSDELRSADKIVVSISETKLLNSEGAEVTIDDLEPGKQVEIFYNGGIAESYPAQIQGCYEIRLSS